MSIKTDGLKSKTIAVIGVGAIGGLLAHALAKHGSRVRIANSRGPESLKDKAVEWNVTATSVEEAVVDADIVIISTPLKAVQQFPPGLLKKANENVVVIETNNYHPSFRDGQIADLEGGEVESVWHERLLGHRVVKVFNGIGAKVIEHGGKPKGAAGRIALPVAGDSESDKAIAFAIVELLGFDAVDTGPIAESWRQEPGQPVYGSDDDVTGVKQRLAAAYADKKVQWAKREESIAALRKLPKDHTQEQFTQAFRSVHVK